jgi:hypothetical protein
VIIVGVTEKTQFKEENPLVVYTQQCFNLLILKDEVSLLRLVYLKDWALNFHCPTIEIQF